MTSGSGTTSYYLIMIVLFVAIFYFFLIRPENKKKKQQAAMRDSLKVGDKITTIGGIVGTIATIKDANLVIETSADRVRMEITKWAIGSNDSADAAAAAAAKAAAEDRKEKKTKKK